MTNRTNSALALSSLLLGTVLCFTGCEKGPAEKMGEKVDNAAQDAKDIVVPPGPVEKVGREVDRTVNP
ncbi:hypothetical protein EP7_002930 [Isosphaeraceae bacterium EP7]